MKVLCVSISLLLFCSYSIHQVHAEFKAEHLEKMIESLRKTCLAQSGADEAELMQLKKEGKFISASDSAKCFIACILEIAGIIKKDVTIDIDILVKQINFMAPPDVAEKMIPILRKCHGEVTDNNRCELAFRFVQCAHKNNPEAFSFS